MKVLVVEDDRKLASFLQQMLSEEGYVAEICSSGAEALGEATTGSYRLIVLDWTLPDLDGLEVCRQLARSGSRTPILMLTARGDVNERVLALRAGADDYLVKPFEVEEFLARVVALLRRSSGPPRWKIGPLEIDRESRRALVGGRALSLTKAEFRLLLHLAHREGQVVTRGELLLEVWPANFERESNVVDVLVSRLRDKLGAHGWMIETVRRRGYRLRARHHG
jgi:DNA-binding response OmpR family regulator